MGEQSEGPERRFRSLMTFGTDDGRPSESTIRSFRTHAIAIVAEIAMRAQHEFKMFDHDMSDGSDHLVIVDGLIVQVAAETCASDRLVTGETAILTTFHHARALYEAHALAWWMCQDFDARWKRVLKDRLRDRLRFEDAMSKSIGRVQTDVAPGGHELLGDGSVGHLPTMFDMTRGNAVLEFDHALFWKFASAHLHAGEIGTAQIDAESEQVMITQVLGGVVRHAAGTLRALVDHFALSDSTMLRGLSDAETWSKYSFPLEVG